MSEQSTVEVGNAVIVLAGINDPFSDGLTTGYLEFYNERHRPALPLTSRTLRDHFTMVWNDPAAPFLWKAGRITGWIEALMENAPQTFKSSSPRSGPFCKRSKRTRTQRQGSGRVIARSPM